MKFGLWGKHLRDRRLEVRRKDPGFLGSWTCNLLAVRWCRCKEISCTNNSKTQNESIRCQAVACPSTFFPNSWAAAGSEPNMPQPGWMGTRPFDCCIHEGTSSLSLSLPNSWAALSLSFRLCQCVCVCDVSHLSGSLLLCLNLVRQHSAFGLQRLNLFL